MEGDELDAATRLSSICQLDEKITDILSKGSAVAGAIAEGKLPGNAEQKRKNFQTALEDYNKLVEEVNGSLRREVKLLHEASHTQLQPLYIPVQAASFGKEKEALIYEAIERQNNGMTD